MGKKLLIESQFFPPIRTFVDLINCSELILEGHENYQKRSFRNRAYISTSQGRKVLSVPLSKGKNNQLPIQHVIISHDEPWQRDMRETIHTAYHNAPYYMFYGDELNELISQKNKSLWKLNLDILHWCLTIMDITIEVSSTASYIKTYPNEYKDMRGRLTPTAKFWSVRSHTAYRQVHEEQTGFLPHLSVIDLIMCLGPESITYLRQEAAQKDD